MTQSRAKGSASAVQIPASSILFEKPNGNAPANPLEVHAPKSGLYHCPPKQESLANMAKLIIQREGQPERSIGLQSTNSIGRLQDCTVQLEDPQISRVHALITSVEGGYLLTDKGSMNGTHLNGTKLERGQSTILSDGDTLTIQSFHLRFDTQAAERTSPPVPEAEEASAALAELEKPPEANILLSHLLEDRSNMTVWSGGECTLQIADIIEETADTKTYRLVGKSGTLFSYKPGQFVTISLDIDGKTVKRSYSISSSPSRPHTLELTIKRVPGGLVSNWMADRASLGDEIKVRGPAGKFSCFNYPSRKMLCIAGGSGITPMMSMLRWIMDTTADVDVTLLYSGRSPSDFIFRKELETISARHSGLRVIFTVTSSWNGTESWTGLTGRICAPMIELVTPDFMDRHVFLCGPKPFSEAIKEKLKDLNYPIANLHMESFGEGRVAKGTKVDAKPTAKPPTKTAATPVPPVPIEKAQAAPKPAPIAAPAAKKAAVAPGHSVNFKTSKVEASAGAEEFLLDVAEAQGVEIDYACREGSCGSCITKLISGTVEMEDNDLSPDELADGMIYPCVARATSPVSLDA